MTTVGANSKAQVAIGPAAITRGALLPDAILLLALSAVGSIATFWRLGRSSLYDWDEATYAEIAREIGVFHDWIHLHWNFMPWFNKPPLYIWLTALFFHFGPSTFTARAVSALAGVGVLAVTYLIGRRLHGRLVGVLAAVVVLCAYQFVVGARTGQSDMLLTLMIWLALYAYLRTEDGGRLWRYAAGAFTGLALLTKGPAALVAPVTIVIALLIEGRGLKAIRSRDAWGAIALALAIAIPWHAAQLLHDGAAFLGQYFGYMVIRRAATPLEGHTGTPLTYLIGCATSSSPGRTCSHLHCWLTCARSPAGARDDGWSWSFLCWCWDSIPWWPASFSGTCFRSIRRSESWSRRFLRTRCAANASPSFLSWQPLPQRSCLFPARWRRLPHSGWPP